MEEIYVIDSNIDTWKENFFLNENQAWIYLLSRAKELIQLASNEQFLHYTEEAFQSEFPMDIEIQYWDNRTKREIIAKGKVRKLIQG